MIRLEVAPLADMGVLRIAETGGTLQEALCALEEQTEENLTLVSQVAAPNLYYLTVLSLVLFFAWQARNLMGTLAFADMTGNPAWVLSAWLHERGLWATCAILGTIAVVCFGKVSWTGPMRWLLLFLDAESRLRFGLEFVRLAELLTRHGASHTQILNAAGSVLGHSRYVAHAVRRARRALHEDGTQWEIAIADGLLSAQHVDLLAGLIPGGRRALYPQAYQALATIQRQLLKRRYRILSTLLRIALLGGCAAVILTLAEGIYSMIDIFKY